MQWDKILKTILFISVFISALTGAVSAAVPSAGFSASPLSGLPTLSVSFTDESSGSPTGFAWFFGDEKFDNPWEEINSSSGWSVRYSASAVALPNGNIVLMGGGRYSYTGKNDTWRSSDGGFTWTEINSSSGWSKRIGASAVTLPNGNIVLMGGVYGDYGYINDTWRSSDGGFTWEEINSSPGWSKRNSASAVALSNGNIVLMGGFYASSSGSIRYNDVWRSSDGGFTWEEINSSPGWSVRYSASAVALSDDTILLMGGYGGTRCNDVWRSSDGGFTWTEINSSSGWSKRLGASAVTLPDDSIVLMGGTDGSPCNDTWRSSDGGFTWTEINSSSGWSKRNSASAVALPNGNIVLMGGYGASQYNDAWRFQPAGSTLQNPSHDYSSAGNYTVTLQAFNADGHNAKKITDYIQVFPSLIAGFSASPTSGDYPLSVTFNDTSTGIPTSWNWSFGDGQWFNTTDSASKNQTHTYASAGNYLAYILVSNAHGSNTSTSQTITVTTPAPTASPTPVPTSSGSGGGSNTNTGTGFTTGLSSGSSISFSMDKGAVYEVTVTAGDESVNKLMITVKRDSSLPSSIDPPETDVYEYEDVTLYYADNSDLSGGNFYFKVKKSWLTANGYDFNDIVLLHYNEETGEWEELTTTLTGEDSTYYYYSADTPSFSWYAIAVEEGATVVPEETAQETVQATVTTTETAVSTITAAGTPSDTAAVTAPGDLGVQSSWSSMAIPLLLVVLVVIVIAGIAGRRKKQEYPDWWDKEFK